MPDFNSTLVSNHYSAVVYEFMAALERQTNECFVGDVYVFIYSNHGISLLLIRTAN